MEITFPEINPYKEILIKKAQEAKTTEEFEEVCAVTEYVDRVQVAAMVEGNLPNIPKDISEQDVLEQKALEEHKENDPTELLKEMYRKLNEEEGDDE